MNKMFHLVVGNDNRKEVHEMFVDFDCRVRGIAKLDIVREGDDYLCDVVAQNAIDAMGQTIAENIFQQMFGAYIVP